jgi:nucleoid-associated protein YgaU
MTFERATIEILDEDAWDEARGLSQFIVVRFNPTEYTLNKAAQIAEIAIPGIDSPILQFVRGQNEKLTLDLFFDTTEFGMDESARDVRNETRSIYQLVKIQPDTHAPPRVRVTWGEGMSFVAIVESVQQKFTLFSPLGIPLRATLSVTFREYKTLDDQIAELNLRSADHTKRYVVQAGDTLSRIAAQVYRDPRAWRAIADQNAALVTNPRRLRPGIELEIPPLDASGMRVVRRR